MGERNQECVAAQQEQSVQTIRMQHHSGWHAQANVVEVIGILARLRTPLRSRRALVEFFCWRTPTAGDVVLRDPFMGQRNDDRPRRRCSTGTGYGCEISPAYCDVIGRRVMNLTGETPVSPQPLARRSRCCGVSRRPGRRGPEPEAKRCAAHPAPRSQSALRTEEEGPGMTAKSRTTNREVAGMGAASPALPRPRRTRFGPSTS